MTVSTRARIAMAIACLAVALTGATVQTDARPDLIVFSGPGPGGGPCGPCESFHADLSGRDPQLSPSLRKDFSTIRLLDVRTHGTEASRYGIRRWPSFVIIADGKVLGRVDGYETGRQLWQDLREARGDRQELTKPASRTRPAAEPTTDSTLSQRVECVDGVCRILQQDLDQVDQSLNTVRSDATAAKTQAAEIRQTVTTLKKELNAARASGNLLQQRLKSSEELTAEQSRKCADEIARLERRISDLTQLARSTVATPSDVASSKSAVGPSNGGSAGTKPDGGMFRSIVGIAMKVGLTAAQSEVLVGLGATAGPAGIGLLALREILKRRRKAAASTAPAGSLAPASTDPASPAELKPKATEPDFKIENLPLQHIDYTSCWAEHWRNQHADPATALRELELYVQAWLAVSAGMLALPGFDDGKAIFAAVNRWVNRQVTDHAQKALTSENTNHKVFYAHTWKVATGFIREGTFRVWAPNPPAADAIDDWVAAKLTEKLTQSLTPG